MEHIALITRIIETEYKAQEIADLAESKRLSLKSDLEQEKKTIREEYLKRAETRINHLREREQSASEETIVGLEQQYNKDLTLMEASFNENKAEWISKLFTMVVGR